jgi:hypothetical protein
MRKTRCEQVIRASFRIRPGSFDRFSDHIAVMLLLSPEVKHSQRGQNQLSHRFPSVRHDASRKMSDWLFVHLQTMDKASRNEHKLMPEVAAQLY